MSKSLKKTNCLRNILLRDAVAVSDFVSDFYLSTRVAVDASVGELWSDKIRYRDRPLLLRS